MLTELQKAKFTKHFQIRDTNNDGYVTQDDYHKLTENISSILGWDADHGKKAQIDGIHHGVWTFFWKPADFNDDGRVSLADHLSMMGSMIERSTDPEVLDQSRRHSQVLFETFDFNGDGEISAEEYAQFFKAAGVEAEWSANVFKRLDMNSNGAISLDEFVLLHQQFFLVTIPMHRGTGFMDPFN